MGFAKNLERCIFALFKNIGKVNMKRKIYDKLLQWKTEKDGTTALMIEGARRIGKSYIAERFVADIGLKR